MIFVTVGTSREPFDRLIRCAESLSVETDVVVQTGASTVRPRGVACVDFMPFSELVARMSEADVVIAHAGVGSVLTALSVNRRPYVVPRRHRFGEAVDDHQVELARKLAGEQLVTLVDDPEDLPAALRTRGQNEGAPPPDGGENPLCRELRTYLTSCCEVA